MMYIQENLTTTPYELPGISWPLPDALLPKYRQYRGLSKLVLNDDRTAILDIVEDTARKTSVEAEKQARAEQEAARALARRRYLPTAAASAAALARQLLPQCLPGADAAQTLALSGLFAAWEPGAYQAGDLCNANNQTWECFQTHDNAVYPDISPDTAAWFTFWRPLHGVSPETARPFVRPTGAHDLYRAGEHMVWEAGETMRCLRDTSFGPDGDPNAWETLA